MKEEFLTEKERRMFARWHNECLLDMEKKRIRDMLYEYVRSTPKKTVLKSGTLLWPLFSYRALAFVLLVVVIGGGWGIARASERSLPGEPLYALKTEWSEPLRSIFHLSPEAKASWQESRIEVRLDEAKRLAAQKKLSDEDIEKIEMLIIKHQALLTRYAQENDEDVQKSEEYPKRMKIEIKSDGEVQYRRYESEKHEAEDLSDEDTNRDRSSGSEEEKKSTIELEEENFQKELPKEKSEKKPIDSKKSTKKEAKESEREKEEEKKEEKESETDLSEERSDSDDEDDDEEQEEDDKDEEDDDE